ncbi:MAG: aminoglycoside phosphotransferase family protein [Chitinophagaceae bacterium]|nr:aminoglycoside phosphotransferase family protein [Chitinophagaceae bacterium]
MLEKVLSSYGVLPEEIHVYGNGLINDTWKIRSSERTYLLQRINDCVFKEPAKIDNNIRLIGRWLADKHPHYSFIQPIMSHSGEAIVHYPDYGYFRLFPFVEDSFAYDVVQSPAQAYEAARQFGLFARTLKDLPVRKLKTTLPCFHDLGARFEKFRNAIKNGNALRITECSEIICFLRAHAHIVETFNNLKIEGGMKLRATHHDTKISNVLFDQNGKGICVIDLDTLMPGYFISDVGDMIRTYVSPVSEEEKDYSRIEIREEYFKAIVDGYLEQMGSELSATELNQFVYSGLFMTYMQALRFLTDYLEDDSYYGASFEKQNYMRALNQATLLRKLLEKEAWMRAAVWNREAGGVRQEAGDLRREAAKPGRPKVRKSGRRV